VRPLYEELKRRNVFRVAAAYLVAAWLVLQVLDVLTPILQIPDWVARTLLYLLILGFVAALILSWVYELTEKGVQRDEDVSHTRLGQRIGGRKLDFVIIALLSVAVAFMVLDKYVAWEPERSVAVLPFENLSAKSEETVFIDGMHRGIVPKLEKLKALDKVIGIDSVEHFRDSDLSVMEIADELDVATILKGDVQRLGDRVRVNVQLIDADDGTAIWAETYERKLSIYNVFAAQADIARNIAAGLHLTLSDEEEEQFEHDGTNSLEAHEEWLLGKSELKYPTEPRVDRAMGHFERALELDPDYVLAWVGITEALNARMMVRGIDYSFAVYDPWRHAVDRALEIDPLSTEALLSLARLKVNTVQFEESEEYILKAIELSPNHAPAYGLYSGLLRAAGRLDEARWASDKSMELEPIPSLSTLINRAMTFLFMGDVEQVEETTLQAFPEHADYMLLYLAPWMGNHGRDFGRALRWAEEARKHPPVHPWVQKGRCETLIGLDMPEQAKQCIQELEDELGEIPELRNSLAVLEGDFDLIVARIEPFLNNSDLPRGMKWGISIDLLLAGRPELAWPIVQDIAQKWIGDEPIDFSKTNLVGMTTTAYLLFLNGQTDRANYLFDGALDRMATARRTDGYGTLDVWVHLVRGDNDKSAAALRESIDEGVFPFWWNYRSPIFDGMRADPELNALLEEMEAEIVRQRRWYEENRNKPLF